MLLFVVHAQFNAAQRLRFNLELEEAFDGCIDMRAVSKNLVDPRREKDERRRFSGMMEKLS